MEKGNLRLAILVSFIIIISISLSSISFAQQDAAEHGAVITASNITVSPKVTKIVAFVGNGCPHCAALEKYFDSIKPDYPELEIVYYEVFYNATNSKLMKEMASSYSVKASGVPLYFIDKKAMSGFAESMAPDVKARIDACREVQCIDPMTRLGEQPPKSNIGNIAVGVIIGIIIIIGAIILIKYIVDKNKKGKGRKKAGKE